MTESTPGLDDDEYRTAFRQLASPCVVTSASVTILALTDGFSRLIGFPRSSLRGRSLEDLITDRRIEAEVAESVKKRGMWSGHVDLETAWGGADTRVFVSTGRNILVFEFENRFPD